MATKTEKKGATTDEKVAAIVALLKANGWTLPPQLDDAESAPADE